MLSVAIAGLALSYGFTPQTYLQYDVKVVFDGFIPILGGQEGKAEVQLSVDVSGDKADEKGNSQVFSEIKKAKILFNNAELPLGVENITNFFPKTTISVLPTGKVLKTNAPAVNLPVRLPGLDAKRFPEITYLPIEFPTEPIEVLKAWSFKRNFGGTDITYSCVARTEPTGNILPIEVTISQSYTTLEDEGLNVVDKEEDAVNRVVTEVSGVGNLKFDMSRKIFTSFVVDSKAESTVMSVKSGENSKTVRKLATRISCELAEKK